MGSTNTATGQKARKGDRYATKWIQSESREGRPRLRARLLRRPAGRGSLWQAQELRGGNQV